MLDQPYRDLLQHMEWADARAWHAALVCEAVSSDAPVRTWLHHLHYTQLAFLRIWQGEPLERSTPEDFPDLAAIQAWARPYYTELAAFTERLRTGDLARHVALPWAGHFSKGELHHTTLGETMLQVAMHSTHHRAQVQARVRALGGTPLLVDYIGWLWKARPAPQWSTMAGGA